MKFLKIFCLSLLFLFVTTTIQGQQHYTSYETQQISAKGDTATNVFDIDFSIDVAYLFGKPYIKIVEDGEEKTYPISEIMMVKNEETILMFGDAIGFLHEDYFILYISYDVMGGVLRIRNTYRK